MRCSALVALAILAATGSAEPRWHQVPFAYSVNVAALDSDSTGWSAGTVGPRLSGFLRCAGGAWTIADTFRNQLVYDICVAGETAWAVGEQFNFPDGIVWRWGGAHWLPQTDPFDRALQAVSFGDAEHGFAGGASPAQHHPAMLYRGGEWRIDSTLTTNRVILGMAATYRDKCYAVGDSGAIFRFQDSAWTQLRTLTPRHLRRVAMESNTEGWAVGDRGTILRCFKDTWALVPSPTTRTLRGLSIAGTSGEAWAVGDSGTIIHCVRDSWILDPFVPEPPYVPLYGVTFPSGGQGWAFGYPFLGSPVALHYYDESTGVREQAGSIATPRAGQSVLRCGQQWRIPAAAEAVVLDATGRPVRTLAARNGVAEWDGLARGGTAAPGVYFIPAAVGRGSQRMVFVR